jgi:hypothetical protein
MSFDSLKALFVGAGGEFDAFLPRKRVAGLPRATRSQRESNIGGRIAEVNAALFVTSCQLQNTQGNGPIVARQMQCWQVVAIICPPLPRRVVPILSPRKNRKKAAPRKVNTNLCATQHATGR